MKPTDLGFNWFDLCVLALLIVGIIVGRKRGMSLELLSVLQWLAIVIVSAIACAPLGKTLADFMVISPVVTYTFAYLFTAIAIKFLFYMIRRMAGEKLVSGAMFGNFESFLGVMSGMFQFG